MGVDPAVAARSFGSVWERLAQHGGAVGWAAAAPDMTALVTGLPIADLNGVWVHGDAVDPRQVNALLDEVASRGVPYCLQGRPALHEALGAVASARGLVAGTAVPLMALTDDSLLEGAAISGLTIRELSPSEYDLHCHVAAEGFEAPVQVFTTLMSLMRDTPGLRIYVAEFDGVAVTTALSVPAAGDAVGIFNVATPPQHRGRGFGAAVTAHAVSRSRADGATWAWLQSSGIGYSVYQRLGFALVEAWSQWDTPAPA
jgi:N-acetylglutamate synthase